MYQMNIDDFINEKPIKQRLVKNHLSSVDYFIIEFLKSNCLGKENAHQSVDIGRMVQNCFSDYSSSSDESLSAMVRLSIRKIRKHTNYMIGSCRSGYYFVFDESERNDSIGLLFKHWLTNTETLAKTDTRIINLMYKMLNKIKNDTKDLPVDGQMQIQFNGWEREFIYKYGKHYLKEDNDEV